MTVNDLLQGTLQKPDVQVAAQSHGHRHVVERTVGLELVQEPETLLTERQRRPLAGFQRLQRTQDFARHQFQFVPALVAEGLHHFPGDVAEVVLRELAFPAVSPIRRNAFVLVETHVAQHLGKLVQPVGHSPLAVLLRVEHVRVRLDFQKIANLADRLLGFGDQILVVQPKLPFGRHVLQKVEDVLVADDPDQLRQLPGRVRVLLLEERWVENVQFSPFERRNHTVRVADQVNVPVVLEVLLRPLQDVRTQRVVRGLVHENPVAEPLLHQAVEFPCREVLFFEFRHQGPGFVDGALLDLHQGADRAVQPEVVATAELALALPQRVVVQQLKLRRRKELRVSTQNGPRQGGTRARRRKHENGRRVLPVTVRVDVGPGGLHNAFQEGHVLRPDFLRLVALLHTFAGQAVHALRVLAAQVVAELRDRGCVVDGNDVHVLAQRVLKAVHKGSRLDRASAELEKVVVDPDLLDPEDVLPHFVQDLLEAGPRRYVLGRPPRARFHGIGQRFAVQFPRGCERELVQKNEVRRDHVVGQTFLQVLAQGVGVTAVAVGNHVSHETFFGAAGAPWHHHALPHTRVAVQSGFDLAQLHAEPANLDLVVRTPGKNDLASGIEAAQVARPVHSCTGFRTERIRQEPLGCQIRTVSVPSRHPGSADVDLTQHTARHRLQGAVEEVHPDVRQRPTDRHQVVLEIQRLLQRELVQVAGDRRLRRSVEIDEIDLAAHPVRRFFQGGDRRLFSTGQDKPNRVRQFQILLFQKIDEVVPDRNRNVQNRNASLFQNPQQVKSAQLLRRPGQDQGGAAGEGGVDFLSGGVEADGNVLEDPVVRAEPVQAARRHGVIHQPAVRCHHGFRTPRRTRRVDEVREVVQIHRYVRPGRRFRPNRAVGLIQANRLDTCFLVQVLVPGFGHHKLDARVLKHVVQPLRRVAGVQRQVGGPGLQDAQQADKELRRPGQRKPHDLLRAGAKFEQMVGDLVGAGIQLAVREPLNLFPTSPRAVVGYCNRVRRALRPGFEKAVYRLLQPLRKRFPGAPPGQDFPALGLAQHGQPPDGFLRFLEGAVHQCQVVLNQGLHRALLEEIRPVAEHCVDQAAVHVERQDQVVLDRARLQPHGLDFEPGDAHAPQRDVLKIEQDLRQRILTGRALRVELVDQHLDRHARVIQGLQDGPAGTVQKRVEGGAPGEIRAHDRQIDEQADQVSQLGLLAIRHGRPNPNNLLIGVPGEKQRVRGKQKHVGCDLAVLAEVEHAPAQIRPESKRKVVAPVGRVRPFGPVRGQIQVLLRVAQLLQPVLELFLPLLAFHEGVVPGRVVEELDGQWPESRLASLCKSLVGRSQITHKHAH